MSKYRKGGDYMTRKDYIIIAKPFNEAITALKMHYKQVKDSNDKAMIDRQLFTVEQLVHAMSNELFHDNYNFDSDKFSKACGLE